MVGDGDRLRCAGCSDRLISKIERSRLESDTQSIRNEIDAFRAGGIAADDAKRARPRAGDRRLESDVDGASSLGCDRRSAIMGSRVVVNGADRSDVDGSRS